MAYTTIVFEDPNTGYIKKAPVGFSWTIFFFSFLVPRYRGDWTWTFILLFLGAFTFGLSNLVFMFVYNKIYIKGLISSGFKVNSGEIEILDEVSRKIGITIPVFENA